MKREDLYVGLVVQAYSNKSLDIGTITKIEGNLVYIDWKLPSEKRCWKSVCRDDSTIDCWVAVKIQTKEEKIKTRIHKLWNNSNWVKKNPQYAYPN